VVVAASASKDSIASDGFNPHFGVAVHGKKPGKPL
jgi:hypothetical protein